VGGAALALAVWGLLALSVPAAITLGVTAWVAWWWMAEPVENPFASLVPLAVLPLVGVLTGKQVALAYGDPLILLLAGGFMLSAAVERSGVHRRLALLLLSLVGGGSGARIVIAFAVATAMLSMWVSNTAAALMMLPVALAVLDGYPDRRLATPLILGVAYAASIGGMGTPIGTPPNLVFLSVYEETTGVRVGFAQWMMWAIPPMLLMLAGMLAWLTRGLAGAPPAALPEPGPWSTAERRVLLVFAAVAAGWVLRSEPFGGWSGLLGVSTANDAAVALLGVVVMGVMSDGQGGRLLDWRTAEGIPWGTLLLFGGGLSLAAAFESTGLSEVIGAGLGGVRELPLPVILFGLTASVTLMSEIASNTATAVLLLPILAAVATGLDIEPARLMVPGTLAASCGFMLPVATAPNAIAHGTERVTAAEMMRHGAVVDLIGVLAVTLFGWWIVG
jgi:sodium-dependent dicarboxylate transporter 2/3/5